MPKLLDFIKEKDLTHEQVIELIEKNYKPEDNTDESDESDTEDEQINKPDQETETSEDEEELDEEALVKKLADEEEAKIKKLKADEKIKIVKLVQEELKRRGKITRKTPSRGEIRDKPTLDYEINVRGYEVKTIKKKK